MVKYNLISILIIFIFCISCTNDKKENKQSKNKITNDSTEQKNDFLDYYNQLNSIKMDFTYDSEAILKTNNMENKYVPEGAAILGSISIASSCKYVIYTYPADIRLPILEIYNNEAQKINELQLFDYSFCMENEGNYSTFKLISNDKMVLNSYNSVLIKSDTINLLNLCDGIIIETQNLLNEVTSRSDTINKSINETDSILNVIKNLRNKNDSTSRNNIDNTFEF